MTKLTRLAAVFLMVAFIAGCVCPLATRPPGQAVASENNFENGVKQYEKSHFKQAIHEFEKAIEKDPTNYKAYFYLGMSYKGEGLFESALKYLEKAIDLNPNDAGWVAKVRNEIDALTPKQGHGKGHDK